MFLSFPLAMFSFSLGRYILKTRDNRKKVMKKWISDSELASRNTLATSKKKTIHYFGCN